MHRFAADGDAATSGPDTGQSPCPVSGRASGGEAPAGSLSARDAAEQIGVSERTIRRAIARGDLPATKCEGSFQISPEALARYESLRSSPDSATKSAPPAPPRLVALEPPGRAPAAPPAPLTALVGREDAIAAVTTLARRPDVRLVTLTGPGGVGKTRLALAAAALLHADPSSDSEQAFPDGVCFVDLAPITDAAAVSDAIARALGLRTTGDWAPAERVRTFLAAKQLLLVLDNMEHLVAAAPELATLLAASPGVTALVTSRRPLQVTGERAFPVAPLTLPAAEDYPSVAGVLASEAGRLFVARAEAIDPTFAVTEETAPVVAAICARLDGLPLAIELAAARVRLLSPAAVLARLDGALALLTSGALDLPIRQQTLRHAIAWSYDLLSPDEQALFRRLAVFSGGFTLAAAEAVGGGQGENDAASLTPDSRPLTPTLDGLAALVDHSLVQRAAAVEDEPRYRLLETVRAFGREQLAAAGETDAASRAHAFYFLTVAEASEQAARRPEAERVLARLESDHANLRAALACLDDLEDAEPLLRLAGALAWFWFAHSHYREGQYWLEQSLERSGAIDGVLRAKSLIGLARMVALLGDGRRAEALLSEGFAHLRDNGDDLQIAMTQLSLGLMAALRGDFERARHLLDEARARAEALDDPVHAASVSGTAISYLGVTAHEQKQLARAFSLHKTALERHQSVSYDLGILRSLRDIGDVARDRGNLDLAHSHYQASLVRAADFGDVQVITDALRGLGVVAAACMQAAQAARLLGAAEALRETVGMPILARADRAARARAIDAVRAQLGEGPFADAWAAGRELTLEATIAQAMALAGPHARTEAAAPTPVSPDLTDREVEILGRLARQETDREIAETLFISQRTVNWHVSQLLAKLGVRTRREAADAARRLGIA